MVVALCLSVNRDLGNKFVGCTGNRYGDYAWCRDFTPRPRKYRPRRGGTFHSILNPTRVLGERVGVTCQGLTLAGQVFTGPGDILSVQDIRDWVGSRLLAERLSSNGVRLQQVVTEPGTDIPAPVSIVMSPSSVGVSVSWNFWGVV